MPRLCSPASAARKGYTEIPYLRGMESLVTVPEDIDARDRLIVALDLADTATARKLIEDLGDTVRFYKIGLSLQLATGVNELIVDLIAMGKKVFLDYKYYDTPETLEKAVGRAAKIGVAFLTIHGTKRCIQAAVRARGTSNLKLFTVTVLTSMDIEDIREMGLVDSSVEDVVLRRSLIAWQAGCDGVIASGLEVRKIKDLTQNSLMVTTPGIRPHGYHEDDQKRKVTPREAVAGGADYLVIGRPITEPKDTSPVKAAERTIDEMQAAFDRLPMSS
jgi:orotidine-5'-phosphate decarboxylase